MHSFLDELKMNAGDPAVSIYISKGLSINDIAELIIHSGVRQFPEELPQVAADSKTGAVIFRNNSTTYFILPSFPVKNNEIHMDCTIGPLWELLAVNYKIGFVLVHLGSYAVGFCIGEELVSSKAGTGLIHGRNKKGGSSQQRFQRRRENQADEFVKRVCAYSVEHFSPHEKEIDYIVYGGPRQTILRLKRKCSFLQTFEERELPLLEVPTIRQTVLEKAVDRIWSCQVIEYREERI